jgi:hypothetical protein
VGETCVSPVAPSRRLSSPLRPRRSLDPRSLFRPTSVADTSAKDPVRSGSTGGGESVGAPIVGTCTASGWRNLDVRERVTSRVSLVDSPLPDQISRYQHSWDRGRAAGQPRVVFIDQVIRPSILRSVPVSSWAGMIHSDHQSFAAVAGPSVSLRYASTMFDLHRGGGRGGP